MLKMLPWKKKMCSARDFNLGIECNSTILFCARNSDVNAMNYFYGMQLFFFFFNLHSRSVNKYHNIVKQYYIVVCS